jgi:hypothetical protein
VPWPYGLRPYGVDRPPLSWLRVGVHERAKMGRKLEYYELTTLVKV